MAMLLPVVSRCLAKGEFCVRCSACNADGAKEASALKCVVFVEVTEENIVFACFVKYWNRVPKL